MRQLILLGYLLTLSVSGCKRTELEPPRVLPPPPPASSSLESVSAAPASSAQERDPLAFEHEEGQPVDHLERARALKVQGEFEEALIEARCAIFHEPEDGEALELTAKLAELTDDTGLALGTLERLGHLDEDDAAPLIKRARLLIATGQLEQARQVALDAIERDAENPESYQVAGRAYLSAGQLGPAISMFSKAVELSPEHGYALNNLGFALLRANRNQEALEVLSRATQLLPRVAYVQNNRGVALQRLGRTEEAKVAFTAALELSPKYLKAQINVERLDAGQPLADDALAETGEPYSAKAEEFPLPPED